MTRSYLWTLPLASLLGTLLVAGEASAVVPPTITSSTPSPVTSLTAMAGPRRLSRIGSKA